MLVTDKKYYMDEELKYKLDLMIKRMRGTDDNVVVIDGDEGQGKSEMAMGICYYISHKTGRKYDIDNIEFDLDKVIKFASSTKEQIIDFDEAVLGLLTTEWQSKLQQKFNKLIMIARKKKHFIVLCIPKFHRLSQYVIEERSIALVHVYSRDNIEKGRFCYFTKKNKELLYADWKKSKSKKYAEHLSFWGTFPIASTKIFTKEQNKAYDDKKDEAILKLGNDEENKETRLEKKWLDQRNKLIAFIRKEMDIPFTDMEKRFKIFGIGDLSMETIRRVYRTHT